MLAAMLYTFFAVFPERSPIDRRVPWLKWFALLFGFSQALPGLATGDFRWPDSLSKIFGYSATNYVRLTISYSLFLLAVVSLLLNSVSRETSVDARRKSRVMLWGTAVGIVPIILERVAADLLGCKPPSWLNDSLPLLVFLYPLSDLVRANLTLSPAQLITQIQSAVMSFSANNQFDDLTLVLARAR